MQRVAVIGLGRLGMELASRLAEAGAEVVAIDTNGRLVDQIHDRVTLAVRMDATDLEALRAQDIEQVDVAVVAIGEAFEAALLTVLGLKELGVRRVVARAQSTRQAEILAKIGADLVIFPELESARRLARTLVLPRIEDHIELASGHSIVQLRAPRQFHNKTLLELNLRHRYGVNVVAIKRHVAVSTPGQPESVQEHVVSVPGPDDVIQPDDVLVLVGTDEALSLLPAE